MPDPAAPPVIRLKIPCSDEREFRDRFAPKYVSSGIFVPTDRPRAIGTRLRLKIELRNGRIGVSGDAMVTGQTTSGPGGRQGMTLRLTSLHAGSIQFELSPVGGAGPPAPALRADPTDEPLPLREELFGPEDEPIDSGAASKPLEVGTREVRFKLQETPKASARASIPGPPEAASGDPDRAGPAPAPPAPTPAPRPGKTSPGGRRRVAVTAVAMAVAVGATVAIAGTVAAHARARDARVGEELRVADARILEGRLAGPGGDDALDHLLAARGLSAGDARVASRLRILADKFEQLGERARARGDLGEAAVHYRAALRADPAREVARQRLRELEGRPTSAEGR